MQRLECAALLFEMSILFGNLSHFLIKLRLKITRINCQNPHGFRKQEDLHMRNRPGVLFSNSSAKLQPQPCSKHLVD